MKEQITIHELSAKLLNEFRRGGYSEATIWRRYMVAVGLIETYCERTDKAFHDPSVTEEFMQLQKERFDRDETSGYYFRLRLAAYRMNELYMTGKISIAPVVHGTVYVLNADHARLLDLFLAAKNYGSNTRNDAAWAVRKNLSYYEQKGCFISSATVDDSRAFLFQTVSEVKLSTLHTLLLYLRHFHIFLKETAVPAPYYVDLFSYKVYREMLIQSYVTDNELEAVLNVIDMDSDKGKRDMAIILLAASTGMRACDIVRMQLTDIDWRRGEIRIVQHMYGMLRLLRALRCRIPKKNQG